MSLQLHAQYFDPYPALAVLPLGKKNKEVRSAGHKTERALLNRIQECLDELCLSMTEKESIQRFLHLEQEAFFPVFSNRQEQIHPYLMKPEAFLWNDFSAVHGIPQIKESFYTKEFAEMNKADLAKHIQRVVRDYLFCAAVSLKRKSEWEAIIEHSYELHPFVQLAREKREVIQAVEKMNRSSLLSLLTPPEDVAFWRHRVEIVMRPYRELPERCSHEKELTFDSQKKVITQTCEICKTKRMFHVEQSRVELEEEPDMDKAVKRIATIERQFNEIASKNEPLLNDLENIAQWKKELSGLAEILQMKKELTRYPVQPDIVKDPFLDFAEQLTQAIVPVERASSDLIWLSGFQLPSISMMKVIRKHSVDEGIEKAARLHRKLKEAMEVEPFQPEDICIQVKNNSLTFEQVLAILHELNDSLKDRPLHLIAQLLKGRTSSQIREQGLNHTPLYGFLGSWEEKDIQKAFKKLEKDGWIEKQAKGYEALSNQVL
ncbi:RQC-minor-2 family DNA-binding protein [Bacillus sp. FJAT-42376]|uniref:RQC-minor-2 family DNA-binding protein n=1 Tax=Bacillus sp. FJAT-42376 TaxID=2014076 RepID=UPI0013DD94D0|nr:RQC-minor-2 family DNA-binding protein [Bacillus sp. FJAT-42376]